ncbi:MULTISPECIES: OmpH family outer membrane protein [unclassified Polaribacter]|uniref:OmpH family outer membrane protein n=1 Tax=unclassified Polaribacter TaxID=196858 RepID=UPI0011BDD955|nr:MULTISPECIES: OmpH family outer membrane protein [unclassified Polaribacter]TXD54005.1 OmpH family outer membrane protein [Polaribacter sp. IC063]TXD62521.1 OmpH family outer membrane protein [Polaribacter sp. IC066]
MKKIFLVAVLLFIVTTSWSQRNQTIAYLDMEYILENVPEYLQAQNTLDSKVAKWRKKLDKQARFIEVLKSDLANEKAILTKDLIEEKEEEITLKQEELRRLESLYFGSNGDMFLVRKQLVKPIQDQVYNAVQSIAKRKKYDFVFEKSTDLVMLYSNKKYDISDLVLATINRTRLSEEKKEQIEARRNKTNAPTRELSEKQQEVFAEKTAKKEAQLEELENKQIEAVKRKVAQREAQKEAIEEKRQARLKQREEKRKLLREKQEAARKKKEDEKKKKEKENN